MSEATDGFDQDFEEGDLPPSSDGASEHIAIVGMALRVPGANGPDQYWENLRDGVESVRELTEDELRAAGVPESQLNHPRYVAMGAPMDDVKGFDAALFGFSPRDAAIMDPQHRHFLEVSWEALEHAGYDPARYDGAIGVFGGSGHNIYMSYNLLTNPDLMDSVGFFLVRHTSNDKDFLVTRVSYLFDLNGPAVNVQTACSTSLVAVHMGVQSLLNGESDMILAGGVTIDMPLDNGYIHEPGEILSRDGHCRAFDAESSGTVFGSGAGVVVLKRLDDALADGDTVHSVIRGTAINNDGSNKVGYLAPSVDGQAAAVSEAIALADVDPGTIQYIECHGTGTEIGDPIEVAALNQVFKGHDPDPDAETETGYCALGSVKTNIGHLDTAAGIASLIKATLALSNKAIPPTLHFEKPNPRIDFEGSPFFVNNDLRPWEAGIDGEPRRAGISSLGVGGTNAHIILEEAPELDETTGSRRWQLLPLSAKGPTALDDASTRLADWLRANPDADVADVAHTLRTGRRDLDKRRFVVVDTENESADRIADIVAGTEPKRITNGTSEPKERPVVFMFTGQGSQYAGMGRDLYDSEPVFRDTVDECADILRPVIGLDIRSLLFPEDDKTETADAQLAQTAMTQPALFTIEYAMARLWMSWGVTPKAMIGHSIGEYTAACVAGVLSLADALRVVATRGRLMQELPGGSMLAIPLAADKVTDYLGDGLSLAARNGPEFCVVAGPDDAVDVLQAKLEGEDLAVRRLHTSHAFHSSMMDPMLDPFTEVVSGTTRNQPEIPYVSNVTGTWISAEQLADPGYWASHVRGAVDFVGGLRTILDNDPEAVLLEVGPGRTLATFAKQLGGDHTKTVVTSIRPPKSRDGDITDDAAVALGALGELWAHGAIADWTDFVGDERRRRIPLPTYPFQHQEFWVEPGEQIRTGGGGGGLTRKPDVADWFWEPTWTRTPWPTAADSLLTEFAESDATDSEDENGDGASSAEPVVPHWLIFDDGTLGSGVADRLTGAGATVTLVAKGDGFERGAGTATIDPADPEQHARLVRELVEADHVLRGVVHLWPLSAEPTLDPTAPAFASAQVDTFYAPLHTVQALGSEGDGGTVDHWIVTRDQHAVTGGETVDPLQALSLGPALVVGREHPSIRSRTLDLTASAVDHPAAAERIAVELLAEPTGSMGASTDDAVIAHRGRTRWVRGHEAAPTPDEPGRPDPIRNGGTYLITGGTGGIGLALAEHLAETAKAKLVLTSRSGLPERDRWDEYDRSHSIGRKVARIRAMEAAGAEVLVLAADTADADAMAGVVASAAERFGTVHGVFHAAGHLADGLMAMKETADAEAVLAAKVTGTIVLEQALADAGVELDFLALFSSTSAVVGNAGQVDYVAANAYLNAFAQRRTLEAGPDGHPTVAIGWGPWAEVGMTVRTAVDMGLLEDTDRLVDVDHPLLDRWGRSDDALSGDGSVFDGSVFDGSVFETDFSPSTHWLLDEHRTKPGTALLPGTGYLDLITATHRSRHGQGSGEMAPLELSNVMFLSPFMVGDDDATTLRVRYENGDGDLVIASGTGPTATEHARGRVRAVNGSVSSAAATIELEPIRARCTARTAEFERYEHEQLTWGPRWDNLRRIDYGDREALATLALPERFVSDLADHPLHPAVLDLATAGAQDLIDGFSAGRDFFVPFSYGRLTQYRPLTGQVFSHIRYRPSGGDSESSTQDSAVFDVTLVDPDGTVLVEIDAFTMRRAVGEIADAAMPGDGADGGSAVDPLLESIANGIGTDDGMMALRRILAGRAATGVTPEVVVVAQDLKALIRRADDEAAAQSGGGGAGISHERPDLSTPFVEPSTDREKAIADIWEDMLGVAGVGIHDDFYELGGHSLLVTQLSARVKKLTAAEVPLMALFESSTIAELSAAIDQAETDLAADGGAPAPKLGRVSRDGHRVRRGAINLAAADGGTPDDESKNDGPAPEAGQTTTPQ